METDIQTEQTPVLTLAGIRFFEHFPQHASCPLCETSDDGPCILVGIDGTVEGNIERAEPVHARCMSDYRRWRINWNVGVIYAHIAERHTGGQS
jgi:hypothetical protein